MGGGTTYHFVTDDIESALAQALEAARDGDVSIHGGASTINQYPAAGLIDELRLHIVPLTRGGGTGSDLNGRGSGSRGAAARHTAACEHA